VGKNGNKYSKNCSTLYIKLLLRKMGEKDNDDGSFKPAKGERCVIAVMFRPTLPSPRTA
jgi:hypothetical protein